MSKFTISADLIRRLSAGRWIIPVLALMAEHGGSRFSVIERRLSISTSVLSRTLSALEAQGWIASNPGHGHPLRPEYLLTSDGSRIAQWCLTVIEQRRLIGLDRAHLGRWSLPLIGEIGGAWRRFSELQRGLQPISPRALSLELVSLGNAAIIRRRPAGPIYSLTDRGLIFAEGVGLT